MRPQITLHMTSSLDGRTLVPRWHPADTVSADLWQSVYDRLAIPHRIFGRSTGEETGSLAPYPKSEASFDRSDHIARPGENGYRVVLDPTGKLSWTDADTKGADLLVVLAEDIDDRHLAGLRSDGVSYLFAGATAEALDLHLMTEKLATVFGITETLLSGGPATSGAFLRAGLIDAISLLLAPTIDGSDESPTLFAGGTLLSDDEFPLQHIQLDSVEPLDGGMVWLRYTTEK